VSSTHSIDFVRKIARAVRGKPRNSSPRRVRPAANKSPAFAQGFGATGKPPSAALRTSGNSESFREQDSRETPNFKHQASSKSLRFRIQHQVSSIKHHEHSWAQTLVSTLMPCESALLPLTASQDLKSRITAPAEQSV